MRRFLKYAWALVSATLLLAGFYYAWYFLGGIASGLAWYYVYYYKREYA